MPSSSLQSMLYCACLFIKLSSVYNMESKEHSCNFLFEDNCLWGNETGRCKTSVVVIVPTIITSNCSALGVAQIACAESEQRRAALRHQWFRMSRLFTPQANARLIFLFGDLDMFRQPLPPEDLVRAQVIPRRISQCSAALIQPFRRPRRRRLPPPPPPPPPPRRQAEGLRHRDVALCRSTPDVDLHPEDPAHAQLPPAARRQSATTSKVRARRLVSASAPSRARACGVVPVRAWVSLRVCVCVSVHLCIFVRGFCEMLGHLVRLCVCVCVCVCVSV